MTTEPTINPEANADDIGVEITMEGTMTLEATQCVAANPPVTTPATTESSPVLKPLAADDLGGARHNDIDMILGIPAQLTVELSRTKVPVKDLLQLAQGSMVELDTLTDEPMDILVNGYLIARGEVVVVSEKFDIRLTDIITPSGRIRKSNR